MSGRYLRDKGCVWLGIGAGHKTETGDRDGGERKRDACSVFMKNYGCTIVVYVRTSTDNPLQ